MDMEEVEEDQREDGLEAQPTCYDLTSLISNTTCTTLDPNFLSAKAIMTQGAQKKKGIISTIMTQGAHRPKKKKKKHARKNIIKHKLHCDFAEIQLERTNALVLCHGCKYIDIHASEYVDC